jgi:hypothetical protein
LIFNQIGTEVNVILLSLTFRRWFDKQNTFIFNSSSQAILAWLLFSYQLLTSLLKTLGSIRFITCCRWLCASALHSCSRSPLHRIRLSTEAVESLWETWLDFW